jgi:hypothetical protein
VQCVTEMFGTMACGFVCDKFSGNLLTSDFGMSATKTRRTCKRLSTNGRIGLFPNLEGAAGDVQEAQETIKNPLREMGHRSRGRAKGGRAGVRPPLNPSPPSRNYGGDY